MTPALLITALKASLLDSASAFDEADFVQMIATAVADYSVYCPRPSIGVLQLVADQAVYDCPADLTRLCSIEWGRDKKANIPVWDYGYPGRLPEIELIWFGDTRKIRLRPAPSPRQIGLIGARCEYTYGVPHELSDSVCTLSPDDLLSVQLRAQAEAMRRLALLNVTRPLQLRDGISQSPKNGTPAFLYAELMREFTKRVTR